MRYKDVAVFAFSITYFICVPAHADQRSWKFDIRKAGTYDVHVQHKYNKSDFPREFLAHYVFQTKEVEDKREMPIVLDAKEGYRVAILKVQVPSPQKVTFTVSDVPGPSIQKTQVYVVETDSVYPGRLFDPKNSIDLKEAKRLREIFQQPENKIDLARAELIIDKMVDPSVDIEGTLKKIEAMVADIKTMAGPNASPSVTMMALKRYLYEPGQWNNWKPFEYNFKDPLGTNLTNKLIQTYLATRKGNCVSMPFLVVILGQRLDLDVTASTAPFHVFVKFKDETGAYTNLEATNGLVPTRDVWYRKELPMSDEAVKNGVYLRALTKKETVAVMADTLVEHFSDRKEFEKLITIADVILEYYPKDVHVIVNKGSAYVALMSKYYSQYRSRDNIPAEQRNHFEYLSENNIQWFAKAESLGWREPKKEDEQEYAKKFSEARQKQSMN